MARGGVRDKEGRPYLMGEHSPKELWNSQGMREVRKKMWQGKKVSSCHHCYYQESVNRKSYRQRFNEEWLKKWTVRDTISKAVKNEFYIETDPIYIDLRAGNLCNLKCRMCNPGNSSKIADEWRKLGENKKFQEALGSYSLTFKGEVDSKKTAPDRDPWEKRDSFWADLRRWAPSLRKLYLTGGEPTLIANNWKLIDHLIEIGQAGKINLQFNINCTHIPKSLINTFSHFEHVCLNLSLDGFQTVNDYIREPSRWRVVETNVLHLLESAKGRKNVAFRVTPVCQIYNILNLNDLFSWVDGLEKEFLRKIPVDLLMLDNDPPFLDIRILPDDARMLSLKRFMHYMKSSPRIKWDEAFKDSMASVVYILKNVIHGQREQLLSQFRQYTLVLDKHRDSSFKSSLPELNRFIPLDKKTENQRPAL